MKLLMLTDMFPSKDTPVEGIFVYELVRQLVKSCEIDLIHPRFWYPFGGCDQQVDAEKEHEWVEPSLCPTFRPRLFIPPRGDRIFLRGIAFFISMIPYLLKKHRESKYDIVHAHMAAPAGFAGVLAAIISKRPILITCHGSDIHTYPRYRYLRFMVRYVLKHAQQVIFVSNSLLETAIREGFSYRRASVIHNGVDQSRFISADKEVHREKLGLACGDKVVLFIGNLRPVKGLIFLIRAIANLRKRIESVQLVLVGKGELAGELKRQALVLGIERHVRFVGQIPRAEIPSWINACDVFCLPSINEGFPTVIPEVLSCGRPVVASKVGGIPEIITSHFQGILVPPQNSEKLAHALTEALDTVWDSVLIRDSVSGYSWEKIAAKHMAVYEAAAQEFQSGSRVLKHR